MCAYWDEALDGEHSQAEPDPRRKEGQDHYVYTIRSTAKILQQRKWVWFTYIELQSTTIIARIAFTKRNT